MGFLINFTLKKIHLSFFMKVLRHVGHLESISGWSLINNFQEADKRIRKPTVKHVKSLYFTWKYFHETFVYCFLSQVSLINIIIDCRVLWYKNLTTALTTWETQKIYLFFVIFTFDYRLIIHFEYFFLMVPIYRVSLKFLTR